MEPSNYSPNPFVPVRLPAEHQRTIHAVPGQNAKVHQVALKSLEHLASTMFLDTGDVSKDQPNHLEVSSVLDTLPLPHLPLLESREIMHKTLATFSAGGMLTGGENELDGFNTGWNADIWIWLIDSFIQFHPYLQESEKQALLFARQQLHQLKEFNQDVEYLTYTQEQQRIEALNEKAKKWGSKIDQLQPGQTCTIYGGYVNPKEYDTNHAQIFEFMRDRYGNYTVRFFTSTGNGPITVWDTVTRTKQTPVVIYRDIPHAHLFFGTESSNLNTDFIKAIFELRVQGRWNNEVKLGTENVEAVFFYLEKYRDPGLGNLHGSITSQRGGTCVPSSTKAWLKYTLQTQELYKYFAYHYQMLLLIQGWRSLQQSVNEDSKEGELSRLCLKQVAKNLLRRNMKHLDSLNKDVYGPLATSLVAEVNATSTDLLVRLEFAEFNVQMQRKEKWIEQSVSADYSPVNCTVTPEVYNAGMYFTRHSQWFEKRAITPENIVDVLASIIDNHLWLLGRDQTVYLVDEFIENIPLPNENPAFWSQLSPKKRKQCIVNLSNLFGIYLETLQYKQTIYSQYLMNAVVFQTLIHFLTISYFEHRDIAVSNVLKDFQMIDEKSLFLALKAPGLQIFSSSHQRKLHFAKDYIERCHFRAKKSAPFLEISGEEDWGEIKLWKVMEKDRDVNGGFWQQLYESSSAFQSEIEKALSTSVKWYRQPYDVARDILLEIPWPTQIVSYLEKATLQLVQNELIPNDDYIPLLRCLRKNAHCLARVTRKDSKEIYETYIYADPSPSMRVTLRVSSRSFGTGKFPDQVLVAKDLIRVSEREISKDKQEAIEAKVLSETNEKFKKLLRVQQEPDLLPLQLLDEFMHEWNSLLKKDKQEEFLLVLFQSPIIDGINRVGTGQQLLEDAALRDKILEYMNAGMKYYTEKLVDEKDRLEGVLFLTELAFYFSHYATDKSNYYSSQPEILAFMRQLRSVVLEQIDKQLVVFQSDKKILGRLYYAKCAILSAQYIKELIQDQILRGELLASYFYYRATDWQERSIRFETLHRRNLQDKLYELKKDKFLDERETIDLIKKRLGLTPDENYQFDYLLGNVLTSNSETFRLATTFYGVREPLFLEMFEKKEYSFSTQGNGWYAFDHPKCGKVLVCSYPFKIARYFPDVIYDANELFSHTPIKDVSIKSGHIPLFLEEDHYCWQSTKGSTIIFTRKSTNQPDFYYDVQQKKFFDPETRLEVHPAQQKSFSSFDHPERIICYTDNSGELQKVRFSRYLSLEDQPLTFVKKAEKLCWSDYPNYYVSSRHMHYNSEGIENGIWLENQDKKMKLLVPFQKGMPQTIISTPINIENKTALIPLRNSKEKFWESGVYFTYTLNKEGKLIPDSQEGKWYLLYLRLIQKRFEEAEDLLKEFRGSDLFSTLELSIIKQILKLERYNDNPNSSAVILHTWIYCMQQMDKNVLEPIEKYFSKEYLGDDAGKLSENLQKHYENYLASLSRVLAPCRLTNQQENALILCWKDLKEGLIIRRKAQLDQQSVVKRIDINAVVKRIDNNAFPNPTLHSRIPSVKHEWVNECSSPHSSFVVLDANDLFILKQRRWIMEVFHLACSNDAHAKKAQLFQLAVLFSRYPDNSLLSLLTVMLILPSKFNVSTIWQGFERSIQDKYLFKDCAEELIKAYNETVKDPTNRERILPLNFVKEWNRLTPSNSVQHSNIKTENHFPRLRIEESISSNDRKAFSLIPIDQPLIQQQYQLLQSLKSFIQITADTDSIGSILDPWDGWNLDDFEEDKYKEALASDMKAFFFDDEEAKNILGSKQIANLDPEAALDLKNATQEKKTQLLAQQADVEQCIKKLLEIESSDKKQALVEQAGKASGVIRKVGMKDAIRAALDNDLEAFYRLNRHLNKEQAEEIFRLVLKWEVMKSQVAQLQRIVDLCESISTIPDENDNDRKLFCEKLLHELDSSLDLSGFDPIYQLSLIIFAGESGLISSKKQLKILQKMVETTPAGKLRDIVIQLIMGGGKTSVIATLLLRFITQEKKKGVAFVVPNSLYQSVSHNLSESLYKSFKQELICWNFDRQDLTTHKLDQLEKDLKRSKEEGVPLLTSTSSWVILRLEEKSLNGKKLALFRKSIELNVNIDQKSLREIEDKMEQISRILDYRYEHFHVLMDEFDLSLDARHEINIPVGEKRGLKHQDIELLEQIFLLLNSNEKRIIGGEERSIAEVAKLQSNQQTLMSYEFFSKQVCPLLARLLLDSYQPLKEAVGEYVEPFVLYVTNQMVTDLQQYADKDDLQLPQDMQKYQDQLTFLIHLKQLAKKNLEKADMIAQVKYFLSDLLVFTLSCKGNRDYGPSPSILGKIVPYDAIDFPTTNEYGNVLEEACKHFQWASYTASVNKEQLLELAASYDEAAKYYVTLGEFYSETPEYKEFQQLFGVSLTEIHSPEGLQKAMTRLSQDAPLRLKIQKYAVQQHAKYYEGRIVATGANLTNQTSTVSLMSGTPWNVEGLEKRLVENFHPDKGTDGIILRTLLKKHRNDPIYVIDTEDFAQFIDNFVRSHRNPDKVRGIIERGGLFEQFGTSYQIAEKLVSQLQKLQDEGFVSQDMQGVLFFHSKEKNGPKDSLFFWKFGAKAPQYIGGTSKEHLASKGLEPKNYFVYYDERHTTGIDILQISSATDLGTVDTQMFTRNLTQGLMRLRQFLSSQNVILVIDKRAEHLLPKTVGELILYAQKVQSKKKSDDMVRHFIQQINYIFDAAAEKERKQARLSRSNFEKLNRLYEAFEMMRNEINPWMQQGRISSEVLTKTFLIGLIDKKLALWQEIMGSVTAVESQAESLKAWIEKVTCLPKTYSCSDDNIGTEQQIVVQVQQQVQQQVEVDNEIDLEIKAYNRSAAGSLLKEKTLTSFDCQSFIDDLSQSRSKHWISLSTQLKKVHYGMTKKRDAYETFFSSNAFGTWDFFHSYQQDLPIFHHSQKLPEQILVCKTASGYVYGYLSEHQAASFKDYIKDKQPRDVALIQPCGSLLQHSTGSKEFLLDREKEDVQKMLVEINVFNGNIDWLKDHLDMTEDWLFDDKALKIKFLRLRSHGNLEIQKNLKHPMFDLKDGQVLAGESHFECDLRKEENKKFRGNYIPKTILEAHLLASYLVKKLNIDWTKYLGINPESLGEIVLQAIQTIGGKEKISAHNTTLFSRLQPFQGPYLQSWQIAYVPVHMIPHLTDPVQIYSKDGDQIRYWLSLQQALSLTEVQAHLIPYVNPDFYKNFTFSWQIAHVPDDQLDKLSSDQWYLLKDEKIKHLKVQKNEDFKKLGPKVCYLADPDSIKRIPRDLITHITPEQVSSCSLDQLPYLVGDQLKGISGKQFSHLSKVQLEYVFNNLEDVFTQHQDMLLPDQIKEITDRNLLLALTKEQLSHIDVNQSLYVATPKQRAAFAGHVVDLVSQKRYKKTYKGFVAKLPGNILEEFDKERMTFVKNARIPELKGKNAIRNLSKNRIRYLNRAQFKQLPGTRRAGHIIRSIFLGILGCVIAGIAHMTLIPGIIYAVSKKKGKRVFKVLHREPKNLIHLFKMALDKR